jgi:hypothetical protein
MQNSTELLKKKIVLLENRRYASFYRNCWWFSIACDWRRRSKCCYFETEKEAAKSEESVIPNIKETFLKRNTPFIVDDIEVEFTNIGFAYF